MADKNCGCVCPMAAVRRKNYPTSARRFRWACGSLTASLWNSQMTTATGHINEADLKRQSQQEKYRLFGLTMPYLFMVFFLIVIPIGWLFYMSFIGRDGTLSMENYARMLKSKAYVRIFLTTFKISFLTTLICAVLGYPLAYFMSQLSNRWANICMIGVLIPFWTSLLVRTYAWLVLLQKKTVCY